MISLFDMLDQIMSSTLQSLTYLLEHPLGPNIEDISNWLLNWKKADVLVLSLVLVTVQLVASICDYLTPPMIKSMKFFKIGLKSWAELSQFHLHMSPWLGSWYEHLLQSICILQHSPIPVWFYPCSYICNCLKMTEKFQINEYSDWWGSVSLWHVKIQFNVEYLFGVGALGETNEKT